MLINENDVILGNKCVLIPYYASHVKKYHEWMQDPELLKQTSSEKLSLEEEYAMQESWRNDEDKLTFIVLDKEILLETNNEIESMAGDINAFVSLSNDDEETFELSVMVAEKRSRGKGIASEAVRLMMLYVIERLHRPNAVFIAKIEAENQPSQDLFKKLNFKPVDFSEVFQLYTYKLDSLYLKNNIVFPDDSKTINVRKYIADFLKLKV